MPATGPNTDTGKAIVRRNAVRHGLYAEVDVVTAEEAETDWLDFHDETVEALNPVGPMETALASRAAALTWRLRRVPAAEAALLDRFAAQTAERTAPSPEVYEKTLKKVRKMLGPHSFYAKRLVGDLHPKPRFPEERKFNVVLRVEAHLNRQLMHTLHELEALQERRLGRRSPLARVDVHGLPGT